MNEELKKEIIAAGLNPDTFGRAVEHGAQICDRLFEVFEEDPMDVPDALAASLGHYLHFLYSQTVKDEGEDAAKGLRSSMAELLLTRGLVYSVLLEFVGKLADKGQIDR